MRAFAVIWSVVILSVIPAYITHLVWVVRSLFGAGEMAVKEVALAIMGTIMPPIGVIHGFVIWF